MSQIVMACGKQHNDVMSGRVYHEHNSFFDTYVDEVARGLGKDVKIFRSINVYFTDERKEGVVGTCYKWTDGHREIAILRSYWDNASHASRIALMAHEIGHCGLNRGHRDDIHNGYPLSLMNTYTVNGDLFEVAMEEYFHELKTKNVRLLIERFDTL
jgi:hypothetical protein